MEVITDLISLIVGDTIKIKCNMLCASLYNKNMQNEIKQ